MRRFRREIRRPTTGPADISWEIGAGYVRTANAILKDLSPSGIGLVVSLPFTVGAKLKITTGNQTRSAIVRRCVRQGAGYILGFEYERENLSIAKT